MIKQPDSFFDRVLSDGWFAGLRLEWVVCLLICIFVGCAWFLSSTLMMRWANSFMLGMGVAVLSSYLPGLWRPGVPYAGRLVIWGVVLTWASATERRVIDMIVWDRMQEPILWSHGDPVLTFLGQQVLFTATLGGLMHVAAPGAFEGKVPDRNWALVGVAAGIGIGSWSFTSYW